MGFFAQSITPPVTNGLIGWWPMSEGTGTTIHNALTSYNTGSIIGAAPWNGLGHIRGNAVNCNGSSQWVSVGTNGIPYNTSSLSISCWIYPTALTNAYAGVFCKGTNSSTYFDLYVKSNGKTAFLNWHGTAGWDGTGTITLAINKWYHLACFCDVTAGMSLYINGVLDKATTGGATIDTTSNITYFGSDPFTGTTRSFAGKISDFRVYGRVLSLAEITKLYNNG